jgi:hypothetical protein
MRFVRLPSSFGIGPDNALMPKVMYCILVNSPMNDGIGPAKTFCDKFLKLDQIRYLQHVLLNF